MKKIAKTILVLLMVISGVNNSYSMLGEKEDDKTGFKYLNTTGFYDYEPFGKYVSEREFDSVFKEFLQEFCDKKRFDMPYKLTKGEYEKDIQEVRTGNIDFVIGAYSASDIYRSIEFIYPAAIINPIHIITLPERTNDIQTIDDLKGLKGVMSSQEHLSDFVNDKIKQLDIQKIDNPYDLFEKLAKGEADYIVGSRYYIMIQAIRLGIKDKISFSKRPLWNIPMFFGVSKSYPFRRIVTEYMGVELKKPEVQKKINNYLIEMIHNIEREHSGVVPPTFIKR